MVEKEGLRGSDKSTRMAVGGGGLPQEGWAGDVGVEGLEIVEGAQGEWKMGDNLYNHNTPGSKTVLIHSCDTGALERCRNKHMLVVYAKKVKH